MGFLDTPLYRLPEKDTETTIGYLNAQDNVTTYDNNTTLLNELTSNK